MGKSKILIIGTGYFGKHIINASLSHGHPTYILARPQVVNDVNKVELLADFRRKGATLIWGSLDDKESLVRTLQSVEVVICCIAHHLILKQHSLIDAIIEAGTIKKFYPSEFGMDLDLGREHMFPASVTFHEKINIRRRIESAGISYTYISAGLAMGWNLASFMQMEGGPRFIPPRHKVCIYKDGDQKVVYTDERDVGTYTIKTVDDPRTLNKVVYFRAPKNIITMNEQVDIWEKKIGKKLEKTYMSEEQILTHMEDSKCPLSVRELWARIFQFFFRGDLVFNLGSEVLEASDLYPEVKYKTPEEYLELYV